ncbi:MAG: hypothetical protein WDO71_08565 [Bacteroidota bacterium]
MHTTGLNSVKMYVPEFGDYYHPGLFDGVLNAFGSQEPDYTINPTTNAVTVQNSFPGATTFYTMAPGFNSHYDRLRRSYMPNLAITIRPGLCLIPLRTGNGQIS